MGASRYGQILAALSFAVAGCTSATAEECIVPAADLVGIQMVDGTCYGATKNLAKIMKVEASQCSPSPKRGLLVAGTCIPPRLADSTAVDTRSTEERIQALVEVIRNLKNEIEELRSDMAVHNNETASDFERIWSRIGR